jgi:hypothetical protein
MHLSSSAVAGLLGAMLALALEWAASRVDVAVTFAPLALGDRLIRLTPGAAATFAIENLGKAASQILAVAVTLAFVALGTVLPSWTATGERHRPFAAGIVFGLGLCVASLVAPVAPAVPVAAGVAAAAGLLYAFSVRWLLQQAASPDAEGSDVEGRRALLLAASSAFGLVLAGSVIGRLLRDRTDAAVAIAEPRMRSPEPSRNGFPRVAGLSPEITPVADHYVVDIDIVNPHVDVDEWRLRLDGLVDTPASLSFLELQQRFELVEEVSVLTCISNDVGGPLIGNTRWTGVRLRDLLRSAGVQPGAVDVVFGCADGYDVSIPLARAMQPTALLAVGQNRRALTREHGFPCRRPRPGIDTS